MADDPARVVDIAWSISDCNMSNPQEYCRIITESLPARIESFKYAVPALELFEHRRFDLIFLPVEIMPFAKGTEWEYGKHPGLDELVAECRYAYYRDDHWLFSLSGQSRLGKYLIEDIRKGMNKDALVVTGSCQSPDSPCTAVPYLRRTLLAAGATAYVDFPATKPEEIKRLLRRLLDGRS